MPATWSKAVGSGDAGGIVKPLKKTLIIEIKCLANGMGRNPRWEDHAELSPGLTARQSVRPAFDPPKGTVQRDLGFRTRFQRSRPPCASSPGSIGRSS